MVWRGSSRLAIPTNEGAVFICHKEIVVLTAEGSYTRVHVATGECHLVCGNLHRWELRLPPALFRRCHRSAVINMDHVVELRRQPGHHAIMSGGQAVVVSRRHWPGLLHAMHGI